MRFDEIFPFKINTNVLKISLTTLFLANCCNCMVMYSKFNEFIIIIISVYEIIRISSVQLIWWLSLKLIWSENSISNAYVTYHWSQLTRLFCNVAKFRWINTRRMLHNLGIRLMLEFLYFIVQTFALRKMVIIYTQNRVIHKLCVYANAWYRGFIRWFCLILFSLSY